MRGIVGDAVTKRHQAVVQMDVFHNRIGIFHADVIVTKIPETADTQRIQPVTQGFHRTSGNTEHCHGWLLKVTKALQCTDVAHGEPIDGLTDLCIGIVKNPHQRKSLCFEGKMGSDGPPQITCTD